jgi:hypothetical protein
VLAVAAVSAGPRTVVYVGPSIDVAEAATILPWAEFRPPVRAGDLYVAWNQGASVLLVIDGQFLQEDALPPREVVDVAQDGALLYGASSMGALRAAECWPVGVRGVGVVYRLFRTGRLISDEEVAVATDATRGFRATSVALVNVRYAVRKAARAGLLDRPAADAIVASARRLFYTDRTWATVLAGADRAGDARLAEFCAGKDLKREDALRLLRTVRAALPRIEGTKRRSAAPLGRRRRQPLPDAVLGRTEPASQLVLSQWMVGSGRLDLRNPPSGPSPIGVPQPVGVDSQAFARWNWDSLAAAGELQAAVMRMHAVQEAAEEASRRGVRPRAVDRFLAEAEIAARYHCTSWSDLKRLAEERRVPWAWIEDAAFRLSVGKAIRAELFARASPSGGVVQPFLRAARPRSPSP